MDDLKKYKEVFEKLNKENKLLFILGLMLRQRNVFLDFCERFSFDKSEVCLNIFEEFYRCIVEGEECELEDSIEELNPEHYEWTDEVYANLGYISTVVDNMIVLSREINERENIDTYFTRCNFDLITAYIFDNTDIEYDDMEAIRNYPDMRQEIDRGISELIELYDGRRFCEDKLESREILLKIKY